jgi:RNA polymerase sigma-70 factor (family 1)
MNYEDERKMRDVVTEKAMILGLRNGSRPFFDKMFLKYNKKVYGLARKFYLPHEDAEEIVQEVFLTIWKRREELNESLSFNAYVFKISQSYIIKFFRRKAYQKAYSVYALENYNQQDQILSDWEMEDLDNLIDNYINLLPEQRKKVFILSRQQNLSHQEIAVLLNISVRTVESHIHKALKFLKQKLSSEEIII